MCTEKIKFNLTFSDKNTYVDADYGKIQQVIYNLIDNAIKFSNNNSFINISTYEKGGKIFISVKDFGIGIPKDNIEKYGTASINLICPEAKIKRDGTWFIYS